MSGRIFCSKHLFWIFHRFKFYKSISVWSLVGLGKVLLSIYIQWLIICIVKRKPVFCNSISEVVPLNYVIYSNIIIFVFVLLFHEIFSKMLKTNSSSLRSQFIFLWIFLQFLLSNICLPLYSFIFLQIHISKVL